jgi:cell division protein FtsZ
MSENVADQTAPEAARRPLTIKFIGVGGAGCHAAEFLSQMDFVGMEFWAVNTDARALAGCKVPKQYQLGIQSTRGLGTGGDAELAWAAAEKETNPLIQICVGSDIVIVAAGLGGGTGTGAAPVVARLAKEAGALVVAFAILPFDCEGSKRQRQAQLGLEQLKMAADGVICLPNQRMFKLIDEKTTLLETFRLSNGLLAQGMRGLWRLLAKPGLINVDFANLCSVIRGKHAESSFATAEASGAHRSREVVEKLLANPLMETGQVLTAADAVLVSIVGGPNLTMAEINRVMEQVGRQCENAQLILGAAIEESMGEVMEITLIASGKSSLPSPEPISSKIEPAAVEIKKSPSPDAAGEENLIELKETPRHPSRYLPPPPELSPEQAAQAMKQQRGGSRLRQMLPRLQQAQLPLEIVSKGRFEKSEPTIHQGEDLDVPTYIRRGMPLN